jgi:hypothetical protein
MPFEIRSFNFFGALRALAFGESAGLQDSSN